MSLNLNLSSFFILIFFGLFFSCIKHSDETIQRLAGVDSALKKIDYFQEIAFNRADSLADLAHNETDINKKIELLFECVDAYRPLDLEKALEYLDLLLNFTDNQKDCREKYDIYLKKASIYSSEGQMLKEAYDIFQQLSPENLPEDLKASYYVLAVQLHKNLEDRAIPDSLKIKYHRQAALFRDSVLKYDPSNAIIASNKLLERGKVEEALAMFLKSKPEESKQTRIGPYYHYLSGLYGLSEKPDSQMFYLSLAAEDDLKHGVREYIALTQLAEILTEKDIDRAMAYIQQSRKDAYASNASIRQKEVAPVYTVITSLYSEKQKKQTFIIIFLAVTLFIILIAIAGNLIILRKKNRLLSLRSQELITSHNALDKANTALEVSNNKLIEESRVKEVYIRGFMKLCLSYLDKMERYRARLGKIAAGGDLNKISDAINSNRYVNEEISEFYESFDKAFFSLYPDFISVLNDFLKENHRFRPTKKLSTELRIYALLWLGVESSGEIAKFLRCSESTVYNYRTQMRNRALDRDNFERDFLIIAREKRHQTIYINQS